MIAIGTRLALALTFGGAGVLGSVAIQVMPAAALALGDPFDDARYHIVNKQNADALRLIDGGSFPLDQANAEGWTLLHFAAEAGNAEMVRVLLERGANPQLRTQRGSTPHDVALGTGIKAAIAAAVAARTGGDPMAAARAPAPAAPARSRVPSAAATPPAQSFRAKLCRSRWYASQALCSDSTCKMREYRKWQTCLQTGSYV